MQKFRGDTNLGEALLFCRLGKAALRTNNNSILLLCYCTFKCFDTNNGKKIFINYSMLIDAKVSWRHEHRRSFVVLKVREICIPYQQHFNMLVRLMHFFLFNTNICKKIFIIYSMLIDAKVSWRHEPRQRKV